MQIDNSIYFNPDRLLSYNCLLSIVIGERGVGKTYSMKDYCIRHFLKQHKKFCWIRRFASDLDEAVGDKELTFFKPIQEKHNYKYDMTKSKKMITLYLNDKVCGYATSLRAAESLKGTEYNDVDTLILDEFLVGEGGTHYLRNEPMYLLSLIETIARLRKIRVILLGNATGSVVNPYFDFFKIHLPYNSEFQTFKNKQEAHANKKQKMKSLEFVKKLVNVMETNNQRNRNHKQVHTKHKHHKALSAPQKTLPNDNNVKINFDKIDFNLLQQKIDVYNLIKKSFGKTQRISKSNMDLQEDLGENAELVTNNSLKYKLKPYFIKTKFQKKTIHKFNGITGKFFGIPV